MDDGRVTCLPNSISNSLGLLKSRPIFYFRVTSAEPVRDGLCGCSGEPIIPERLLTCYKGRHCLSESGERSVQLRQRATNTASFISGFDAGTVQGR